MPKGRGGAREGRRWGGGYFFVNNQEKTRGNRQNMKYTKLGMEGGGGRGGRRDTEIIVLRY
jgi:hypothetical protein